MAPAQTTVAITITPGGKGAPRAPIVPFGPLDVTPGPVHIEILITNTGAEERARARSRSPRRPARSPSAAR